MNAPRPWLVIPVRSLTDGKQRLAPVLDAARRRALNEAFLHHVLQQAAAWPGLAQTLVVSPCDDALALARQAGARTLHQHPVDGGHNAALVQAAQALRAEDAKRGLMVVSSDLPTLRANDLQTLAEVPHHCVIATDRAHCGSNALFLPAGAPLLFRFGVDSRRLHYAAFVQAGWPVRCIEVDGLAFDVDTPEDLALVHELTLEVSA